MYIALLQTHYKRHIGVHYNITLFMLKRYVQHMYSKQIYDTHRSEIYREAIILNVFYKNIHIYTTCNIYSKQYDIDIIINELSFEALYMCLTNM